MNSIFVPVDKFTVSAGGYKFESGNELFTTISYDQETNTSEYFINKLISNLKNVLNLDESCYQYNYNQNYITFDYHDNLTEENFFIYSTTTKISTENYWMYPTYPTRHSLNTINFPVTRTISIIINSNTLPVYTIDKDITLDVEAIGSHLNVIIPAGKHTYSTVDTILFNFIHSINEICDRINYFNNIKHFLYTRFVSLHNVDKVEKTGKSVVIRNNDDFNKYYGLLHMVYTYPADLNVTTTNEARRFSTNMPPVYRSLNIPTGFYTPEEFVNYINTHSEYHYTQAGVDSLSYTQFLAKIVNNDIVIYTDDGTKFFINPICKMNVYQEKNFASEHRLCPTNYIPYLTDSIIVKQGDQINIPASKLKINLSDNTIATNYTITCNYLPDELTWSNNILTGKLNQTGIFTVYFTVNTNVNFVLYLISI